MSGNICKTPVYADRGHGVSDQDVSELALYAGHILLESGAELSRVEDTIKRIHDAYGVDSEDAFVLSNGFIGLAGWLAYSLLKMRVPGPAGIFLAASAVVVLSRIFAVRRKCPASIFMVPGLFPLVPGAGIYWAVYGLVSSDGAELASSGRGALSDAVAIVLGIIIVSELPQSLFSFIGKKHFFK